MKNIYNKYDITQCALYKCSSPKRLKKLLRLSDAEYKDISSVIGYHKFEVDKKDGVEKRKITAPDGRIKQIQARMLELLQKVERPAWLISGEKGKCYIDNGKMHMQSNFFLTMDIKSFYDNCKREYVYRLFKDKLCMSGDIAGICTNIVTYNGGVPTGCPTSQLLAYYAYENMFKEIYGIACEFECIFSLYVDDMTFSSKIPFDVTKLKKRVDVILHRYGHKLKYKKLKYYSHGKAVPITGTIVNREHELKVPNSLQKKIYFGFQEVKALQQKHLTIREQKQIDSLKGQIQAARNIEQGKFPEIQRLVSQI